MAYILMLICLPDKITQEDSSSFSIKFFLCLMKEIKLNIQTKT